MIDFVIHSIAWSPLDELHGRLVDSSSAGLSLAMDISCHSFIRTVCYIASELGVSGVRVEAGSGITDFDGLMGDAVTRSPLHRLGKPEDVGRLTAFLISDLAASQTGSQMFVDAGHHIIA